MFTLQQLYYEFLANKPLTTHNDVSPQKTFHYVLYLFLSNIPTQTYHPVITSAFLYFQAYSFSPILERLIPLVGKLLANSFSRSDYELRLPRHNGNACCLFIFPCLIGPRGLRVCYESCDLFPDKKVLLSSDSESQACEFIWCRQRQRTEWMYPYIILG